MASKSNRSENIYFRIVGLKEHLLEDFKRCVVGHEIKTAKYMDTDTLVVSIIILKKHNYMELCRFLASNASKGDYGIYISLVTDRDNDGVHVPDYVLDFYKLIGGDIDFSFVCG